jgi:putative spermidine/putrescine transport system permease protein
MIRDTGLGSRLWRIAVWAITILFVVNLLAMIATVVINSFASRWLGTWLPLGATTRWYMAAWDEFQLQEVLIVTFQVVFAVVAISGLLGVTAAYALARRDFPGKRAIMLVFLLPLMVPPRPIW